MNREQLEARIAELQEQHTKGAEQLAMIRGAVVELRRLLVEFDKESLHAEETQGQEGRQRLKAVAAVAEEG